MFWSTCAVVCLHTKSIICHVVYTLIRSHSGQISCILYGSFSILLTKWGVPQFVNIRCVDKAICKSPVKYTPVNLSPSVQTRYNAVVWCYFQVIQMSHVLPTCNKHHIYYLQSVFMSPSSGCLALKSLEYMRTEIGRHTDRLTVQNTYGGDEI